MRTQRIRTKTMFTTVQLSAVGQVFNTHVECTITDIYYTLSKTFTSLITRALYIGPILYELAYRIISASHNFANLHSKTNLSFFGSHKYNFQILNVINIIEFLICLSKMCAVGATKTKNRAKITPVCRLQFKL